MKAFKIFSRETNQIFAISTTLEKAEQIRADVQRRDFEIWQNETYPKARELMKMHVGNMCRSNGVEFAGEIVNPADTLEKFLELKLNPHKYDDDGNVCSCENPKFCDCTYKSRDSIEIEEINILE